MTQVGKSVLVIVAFIVTVTGAALLSSCAEQEHEVEPAVNDRGRPRVNVLRSTLDSEDITDVSIFCIDGVKYVVVPGIGMSVKYYNDGSNDPYPETCVNK